MCWGKACLRLLGEEGVLEEGDSDVRGWGVLGKVAVSVELAWWWRLVSRLWTSRVIMMFEVGVCWAGLLFWWKELVGGGYCI